MLLALQQNMLLAPVKRPVVGATAGGRWQRGGFEDRSIAEEFLRRELELLGVLAAAQVLRDEDVAALAVLL
ncbi:MAG: hypothetical protein ACYC7B_14995 [Burkholderiales bacterium]